ncbi:MAG: sulfatase-like hydrolase/transferase, partial [Mariniphaga sp.]
MSIIIKSVPYFAFITFGCMALNCNAQQPTQKPNVIFIYADDIGYGDVSCNGAKTIHTPNVEFLAGKGVRFTNMHSTAATCTPSRYAVLTGEYAWRRKGTGIATGDAGSIIRPERYTLADVFKNSGYQTGVIGKWHLGLGNKTGTQNWNGHITPGPSDLGFDYSFILAATGDRVPCVYLEDERVVNLDPNDPISVSYERNFEGEPTGKSNPE